MSKLAQYTRLIRRVATTFDQGDRYEFDGPSMTSTRDFLTSAAAIKAAVEDSKFFKRRSITDE
jgi:hypothetical protein